jgi:hypothetical protein
VVLVSATMLRVRVWTRPRWRLLVVTALLIGVIGGVVIGLAAGARRTASAPDRYTSQAGGDPDLLITQQGGAPLTEKIAGIPGVADARSNAFVTSFLVAPDDGSPVLAPNPFAGDDRWLGARVDAGRFVDPGAPDEFTVNRTFANYLADHFGTKIGDQFQVTSFDQDQLATNRAFSSGEPPAVPLFMATFVGVTDSPSAFDDSAPAMVFSQSFLQAHPTVGVVQTMIAVRLQPGADPDAVMAAVHNLPDGGDASNAPYRIVSADARRAVRFQVTALWFVTAIAALAAVFVVAQLVGRALKTTDADGQSLMAIGWRSRDMAIERAIEGCSLAAIAVPVAAVIGFALTTFFPLGLLRSFEPHTGRRMDWTMTGLGTIAALVVVVVTAAAGRRRFGRARSPRRVEPFAGLVAASGAGVALAAGAHLTTSRPTGGRRSLASLAPGAIGLAGLVAAGIVGLSLTNIVTRPARWGVNYDQLAGNPFIAAEDDIVAPVVDDPDVAELSAAYIGSLTISGRDVATLAFEVEKGDLVPTTLRGRPPANAGEIGLGAEVLRRLHVEVGDTVHAVGPTGTARDLRVVGTVVTPSSAGNGAAMTFDGYVSLSPTATKNVLLINFRAGAPADAGARLQAANFTPPDAIVTPTSVRALQRVTAAPFVLVTLMSVFLVIACTYLLTTSVRSRGRDLAVLRALGSDSRQLRSVVHWHATLVAALVVLVGFPAGVILGRWVVRLLTTALGIVPGADVPLVASAALVLFAVLVANLLALMPARRAARQSVRRLMLDR